MQATADAGRPSGTGIPDHSVTGGNFATPVSTQRIAVNFTMAPAFTGAVTWAQVVGYALNSVKLDQGTAGTCTSNATSTRPGDGCVAIAGQDPWRTEALGGAYHYHGMPEGVFTRQNKGTAMTLVGCSVDGFPMGTFQQDYAYVAGSGDLDECNGRTGVTPAFPNGIYHYYITDTYPYIQRCIKGVRPAGGGPPPPP